MGDLSMPPPIICPARSDEYDEVARVWMESRVSTGREDASHFLLLRCVRENEKAWHCYEREGFVFEKEEVEPMTGFMVKCYRWNKQGNAR